MSKETYVGGDIIEWTGGNNLSYAKEEIINSSNRQIVQKGENGGVIYGTNGEAPAFNNTQVDFYVDIFRSKAQIPNNFGLKDTEYKGTFGFDRYNEATSGNGKQSLSGFEEMGFNENKYYAPWLCLWPPKKHLETVAEIDKSYSPVTNAILTFKICEGIVKSGNAKFVISSNHPNLKIDGAEKVEKQGTINSTVNVTISCEGILERDVIVEMKNEQGIIVGKLKVVKNNTIYIANTKFITVMEEEKATTSVSKQQKREAEKTKFQSLIKDVIVYLNKNSLNQSLIYVKGTVEDIFIIEKGEINRSGSDGDYSNSITRPYFEGKNRDEAIDESKETKEEKDLDKAIRNLFNVLDRNYKRYKKNTYFCEDTVSQTDSQLFKIYEEKYQAYLNSIESNKKVGGHIRDDKTVYVFVDKNQETLNGYYGYTFGAENCAFVFNQHVRERKFGTFAHEIAHSLGLDHTFELNEKGYIPNRTIDRDIAQKEKTLEEKKRTTNQTTSSGVLGIQNKFTIIIEKNLYWPVVQKPEQISANFNGSKESYYSHINSMFTQLKSLANSESKAHSSAMAQTSTQIVNPIISLQTEITELKTRRLNNQNKYIDVDRSLTQENFMDYDYDFNNITNSNFDPKSFFKWQWDNLKESEFLIYKNI